MFNFSTEDPLNETGFDLRVLCCIGCICSFVVQMVNTVYSNSILCKTGQEMRNKECEESSLFLTLNS